MYSDEIIKQELERYKTGDKPVGDDEIKLFKEGIENNAVTVNELLLKFVYGRSFYWSRLMESVGLPAKTTPDELDIDHIIGDNPQFEIGFNIAIFKLCGVQYAKKEEAKPEPKPVERPKAKKGKKMK